MVYPYGRCIKVVPSDESKKKSLSGIFVKVFINDLKNVSNASDVFYVLLRREPGKGRFKKKKKKLMEFSIKGGGGSELENFH